MPYMQGLDLKGMKKHPALIPLFLVLGLGCATAVLYVGRLAIKNPDVTWNHKGNPEPWNVYKDKTYKLFSPGEGKEVMTRPKSFWG